jgi:tetratricopeptide (TPR) repeat protein
MLGLVFSARAQKELSANFNRKLDRAQPISRTDLDQIGERIKHMNIVSYAEGYLLMVKAIQNRGIDSATVISCLSMSIEKFEDVLNSNTNNKITLRACANALLLLNEELELKSQYKARVEDNLRVQRAIKYMVRAIDIDPTDPLSLLPYASFLHKIGKTNEAEQHYLRALEAAPTYTDALRAYAEFLQMRGQSSVAAQVYERINLLAAAASSTSTSTTGGGGSSSSSSK